MAALADIQPYRLLYDSYSPKLSCTYGTWPSDISNEFSSLKPYNALLISMYMVNYINVAICARAVGFAADHNFDTIPMALNR